MSSSFLKLYVSSLWELSTPKNISYFWGFGSFLGIVLVVQTISGLLLAFYYVRGRLAWESVVEITREVNFGWLFRLIHGNTASFVFVVLFLHFFRGLIQRSFYLKGPWIRGWIIKVFIIMAAFLGYVLPWGQISFWGATVIINLLRVLPLGKTLVIWLWGGFYVSRFTCRFFYAIHFIVPFLVLVLAGVHLMLLHFRGRRVAGGLGNRGLIKIKFSHPFLYKDTVNIRVLWAMWLLALSAPDWSADPVNFVPSDLSSSPIHIQPEWYFLHLYAILRSIPNKIGGLIGFAIALVILLFLSLASSQNKLKNFNWYDIIAWSFLSVNIVLLWLGMQPVESPYVFIGQVLTFLYFTNIFLLVWMDQFLVFVLS